MAFIEYAVEELSSPLKIEDSVIAYAEAQMGPQRNTRLAQRYDRVRLGLQTSPENFFYNEGQWTGAPYVNLNALEFTSLSGTAEALAYDTLPLASSCSLLKDGTPAEIWVPPGCGGCHRQAEAEGQPDC